MERKHALKPRPENFLFFKSALSNIISETRDELDPKCTGGGIMGLMMFVAVSCNHRVSDSPCQEAKSCKRIHLGPQLTHRPRIGSELCDRCF